MLQDERGQPGLLDALTLRLTGKSTLDLLVLRSMAQKMSAHLQSLPADTALPSIVYALDRRSRTHRMVVYQQRGALYNRSLLFVGFISAVQAHVSAAIIEELHRVDKLLVQELAANPGLLTYSSLELSEGRWYNLVLLRDDAAHAYFKQNSTHKYAAHQLATCYYAWIRLHNGVLPGGLPGFTHLVGPIESESDKVFLQSTKHFTFPGCGQKPIIQQIVRDDDSGRNSRL